MARIKTRKTIDSFRGDLDLILKKNDVYVAPENKDLLYFELQELFNNYRCPRMTTQYWDKLVPNYFRFYRQITGVSPAFSPIEAKALKGLDELLKKRYQAKYQGIAEWTETVALQAHTDCYNFAIKLPYVKSRFCASYIYNNFDKIVSEISTLIEAQRQHKNKLLGLPQDC